MNDDICPLLGLWVCPLSSLCAMTGAFFYANWRFCLNREIPKLRGLKWNRTVDTAQILISYREGA